MTKKTVVAIAAGALLVLSACGSDETTGATEASGSPGQGVCDALARLQSSVGSLGDISIEAGMVGQLQDTAQQIRDDASAVRDAAGEELSAELEAFDSAVQAFGDDIEAAVSDPSAATLSALGTDLADIQQAWEALKGAAPDCGP